ncbi:MAG TPA: TetR/AcrR family transcriptional regulator [Acidobacteriota bacterium]|jgi:AcrR family transcriptional regulator
MQSKSRGRYRRYESNRVEILRAAAREFSRHGFAVSTMKEIGERIQMTKGNLYYYFQSKHELLYFCQEYSLNMMLAEARQVLRREKRADAQLREIIRAQLGCMLDEMQASAAHIDFRDLPSGLLRSIIKKRDRYERLIRWVIQRGIQERVFRVCDVRAAAWAVLGALNWTAQWYRPGGPMSVDQIAGEFADLLVGGLLRRRIPRSQSANDRRRRR